MVGVKWNLLPKQYEPELSIGAHVLHNSYYLPRRTKRSKIYKEYHTYEGFGYSVLDTYTERRRQLDKEYYGEEQISNVKKRVLTR